MISILRRVFRPAPLLALIEDLDLVEKNYTRWRLRIFFAMYIGYAFFYFTRQSFPFAMAAMESDLGLSKVDLGFLSTTLLSVVYGVSKFASGILGDRSNPRYFMSIGLIITGILNILFSFSTTWWVFALFWGLNGWFQGWGWPGCAKLLTSWYARSERGRWWSMWNTSHNLGGWCVAAMTPLLASAWGWRAAIWLPGVLAIIVGFFLMSSLRDTPESLGLPSIEVYKKEESQTLPSENEKGWSIFWDYVLCNRFVWLLAFGQFFIYVVRTAVNFWTIFYLMEVKHFSYIEAGFCVSWFEIGGLFGSLASGWLSDIVFQGKRNPINVLFNLAILGLVVLLYRGVGSSMMSAACLLFSFGFFIFGPQMLIGMAAAELSHKKAVATATGFTGCFSYLGAAVAGWPLAHVVSSYGWQGFVVILFACSALGALTLLPLWSAKVYPHRTSG